MFKYQIGYAKSGKSTCGKCKKQIHKNILRIAVARKINGIFTPKWYHEECFFNNSLRIGNLSDFEYFNTISSEDRMRICSKLVDPNEILNETNKTARHQIAILSQFRIEISTTYQSTCYECKAKVLKHDMMMSRLGYNEKFGEIYTRYHVRCFSLIDNGLDFSIQLNDLPGFNVLSEENQTKLRTELNIKGIEPFTHIENIELESASQQSNKENDTNWHLWLFEKYQRELCGIPKTNLEFLCKFNGQRFLKGTDKQVNQVADCMAFGALECCPDCGGQLQLETFYYECTGFINCNSKCDYRTKNPARKLMLIPDEFSQENVFMDYIPSIGTRLFCDEPVSGKNNKMLPKMKFTKGTAYLPLRNVQFYLYGYSAEQKDALKRRILKLGGVVASRLVATVAAVLTDRDISQKQISLDKIQELEIHVIKTEFLNKIESSENLKVVDSLAFVEMFKIADWGSDIYSRVPRDVLNEKPVRISSNVYITKSEKPLLQKVKIKDGVMLEAGSWLEESAHVYREGSEYYTATLCRVDCGYRNMQNYSYRLQLLENDHKKLYAITTWWAETGQEGKLNIEEFQQDLKGAKNQFKKKFFFKTGNLWDLRHRFFKRIGKYDLVKTAKFVDIGPEMELKENLKSSLPMSLQRLMVLMFDINVINMTIAEMMYDSEKLPLGVLAEEQIQDGFDVLYELTNYVIKGKVSISKIKELTNKFYTKIPHRGDISKLTTLDNMEIIADKYNMLSNLRNTHTTYKLLVEEMKIPIDRMERCYENLKTEIHRLGSDTREYEMIMRYINNTTSEVHDLHFNVDEIYKVDRYGETERYKAYKSFNNRMLLWHGSRLSNIAGILKTGLRIAPAEARKTGAMFGKGVYFADVVTKSAQYLGVSEEFPTGILLLCEVALGQMKKCCAKEYVRRLEDEFNSVWGVGQLQPNPDLEEYLMDGTVVPLGNIIPNEIDSHVALIHNEYVVYDEAQINIKYLVQITMAQ